MERVPRGEMLRLDLLITPEAKELLDLARPEGLTRMAFLEDLIWGHPTIQASAKEHGLVRRDRAKEGRPQKHEE